MLGKGTAPIQGFVVLKALEVASTDLLGAISYLPNLLRGASGLLRVRGVVLWGGRGCSPGDLPGCAGLLRLLLLRLLLLLRVLLLTWIRILDVRTGTGVMPLVVLRVVGILAVFVVLVARGIVHQHRVVAVLWVLIRVVMLVLVVVVLRVVGILAVGRGNIAQPYTGIFNPILLLLLLLFDGTTTRIMVSRIVVGILALGRRNIAQPYARIFRGSSSSTELLG